MSGKLHRRRNSRASSAAWAASAGAVFGAVLGALVGASYGGADSVVTGALVGALLVGLGEALTDAMRRRGEAKPLFWRVLVATFTGAALGALFELALPDLDLVIVGLILGLLFGLFGVAVNRLLFGVGAGIALGLIAQVVYPDMNAALLGAATMLAYRVYAGYVLKGQEPLQVVGERVPHSQVRMVVPFDASTGYVGADYFRDLARTKDGAYKRNTPGAGIVESMESMRGPEFDPERVDPLIREFYEHTTRFELNIVPEWKRRMLPLFWLFKRGLAQRVGQANLPFDVEEAQRGVVSYIDTIDFDCDDVIDLRGWVRAFEETGEAIYVGVYTTFRDDDVGYVSVGFPFPGGNFTATLLPYNLNQHELLLKTRATGRPYPGHYLSTVDAETGELTVLQVPNFDEEIHVYVKDDQLRTDHRFYLSDLNFLTLYYTMQRLGGA